MMGSDGIDKADIFDEYFDNKPKITNFQKVKAMNIDEFAEWMARSDIFFEVQRKTLLESIEKDWTPVQETLNNIYEFKLWLGSEAKEWR
jgi:hypothetical protein